MKELKKQVSITYLDRNNEKHEKEINGHDCEEILNELILYADEEEKKKIIALGPVKEVEVEVEELNPDDFEFADWGRKPESAESDSSENSADR